MNISTCRYAYLSPFTSIVSARDLLQCMERALLAMGLQLPKLNLHHRVALYNVEKVLKMSHLYVVLTYLCASFYVYSAGAFINSSTVLNIYL